MELQLRLFGIPVQVSLIFFLVVWLIRPRGEDETAGLGVAWILIAFVGVMLHELGHALTARRFGETPRILLHAMGGLTFWRPTVEMSAVRRIAIAASGPGVGIALGLVAWAVAAASGLRNEAGVGAEILRYFVRVNLGWGVFNLLPMLPLDGGAILAAALEGLLGPTGRRVAHGLSIAIALAFAAVLLMLGAYIGAALCGLFVYTNLQGLRPVRPAEVEPAPPPPPLPPAA